MDLMSMMDPRYWLLVGPTILLALWAQARVKSAYTRYGEIANRSGISGMEAAERILRREGIANVTIEQTEGWLSDHYDPAARVLRLSPGVYQGRSIAAVAIAAHEAGHAIQHAQAYSFLGLRSLMVPVAKIGSSLAMPLIVIGMMMGALAWVKIGILFFGCVVAFQFVTLPVEFDASRRAKDALGAAGLLGWTEEVEGVDRVLGAAAWTYVAAAIGALAQLLYFLMRAGLIGGRRDED